MATNSIAISKDVQAISSWQGVVVVLGRFFFALIFLFAAPNHFTKQTIAFSASQLSYAEPFPISRPSNVSVSVYSSSTY
jgi:hypothetical protein